MTDRDLIKAIFDWCLPPMGDQWIANRDLRMSVHERQLLLAVASALACHLEGNEGMMGTPVRWQRAEELRAAIAAIGEEDTAATHKRAFHARRAIAEMQKDLDSL